MDGKLVQRYAWGRLTTQAEKENKRFERLMKPLRPIVDLIHKELIDDSKDDFYYESYIIGGHKLYCKTLTSNTTQLWTTEFRVRVSSFAIHPTLPLLITTEDRHCWSENLSLYLYNFQNTNNPVGERISIHVGPSCAVTEHGIYYTRARNNLIYYAVLFYEFSSRTHKTIYTETDSRFLLNVRNIDSKIVAIDATNNKLTSQSILVMPDGSFRSTERIDNENNKWLTEHVLLTNHGFPYYALVDVRVRGALWASTEDMGSIIDAAPTTAAWLIQTIRAARTQVYYVSGAATIPVFASDYHRFMSIELLRSGDGEILCRTLSTPDAVCKWDTTTNKLVVLRQRPARLALNVAGHAAISSDGKHIPYAIVMVGGAVRPKGIITVAYGAYGTILGMTYPYRWLPLLRRGYALVMAFVRGGGEDGDAWYHAGVLRNRGRGRQDLAACITSAQRILHVSPTDTILYGRSAGGFLAASTANRFGNLIGTLYMEAPYLDVLTTTSTPALPLTQLEYDEFGNPIEHVSDRRTLEGLSPVDNINAGPFPQHVIIRTATHDSQVFHNESDKWVAAIRQTHRKIYVAFHTDVCQGHFVAPELQLLNEAQDLALILTPTSKY